MRTRCYQITYPLSGVEISLALPASAWAAHSPHSIVLFHGHSIQPWAKETQLLTAVEQRPCKTGSFLEFCINGKKVGDSHYYLHASKWEIDTMDKQYVTNYVQWKYTALSSSGTSNTLTFISSSEIYCNFLTRDLWADCLLARILWQKCYSSSDSRFQRANSTSVRLGLNERKPIQSKREEDNLEFMTNTKVFL